MDDKQDGFQDLIRNFSLNGQPPPAQQRPTQRRPAQPPVQQRPGAQQAAPPPRRPAAPPSQRPASGRPAGGMPPQRPYSPPSRQPAPHAPPPGRFPPQGFDAAGQRRPVPPPMQPQFRQPVSGARPPQPPARDFHLDINSGEYRSIPDAVPPRAAPGGGARPPAGTVHPNPGGGQPEKIRKKKKKRGGVSRFFQALFIVAIAVASAVFLSIFALQSAGDMLGMNKEEKEAVMEVGENASLADVAKLLNENGIITQPFTFEIYAKFTGKTEFKPGNYTFNSKMAYSQILDNLLKGGVNEDATVRITFPEGRTILQVAEELEKNNVCTARAFLDAADHGTYNYEFITQVPNDSKRFHRLEGYIFPDTYDFYVNEDPESVVNRFLNAFNRRVSADLYDVMADRGMTLDQTITLASIIQKETGDIDTMYDVSSVFHNRLKSTDPTMRHLQSDATTDYIEKQIKPNIAAVDQAMIDAYDTWTVEGLPIGPINNPGMDAIQAALDPVETPYLYFLSDQKGEYHFSQTYQEHLQFLASAGDAHGTSIQNNEMEEGAGSGEQ